MYAIRSYYEIAVNASGHKSRVARIVTMDGDLDEAIAGQAVTLTLQDEIDISRGDLLADVQLKPDHSGRYVITSYSIHYTKLYELKVFRLFVLMRCGITTEIKPEYFVINQCLILLI